MQDAIVNGSLSTSLADWIGRHHMALLLDLGEGILRLTDHYNLKAQVFDEYLKRH
jgi:hypothetical protein